MRIRIKKRTLTLFTTAVFIIAAVWAIVEVIDVLNPLNEAIERNQRVLAVLTNEETKAAVNSTINELTASRNAMLLSYLTAIIFLSYMATVRILRLFDKSVPSIILPVIAAVNIVLLGFVASIVTATFFTIAMPLVFLGVLPLLIGLKFFIFDSN